MPTVISDPKPSVRCHGWDFVYYDRKTTRGTDCLALIPPSLRGVVKRGFTFQDESLHFDETLRSWVLSVDFDEPPTADPAQPSHSEAGWRDPDYPVEPADPIALQRMKQHLDAVMASTRPEPVTEPAKPTLDPSLAQLIEQVALAYNYTCRCIGVSERPRAMEAQKLATTALIPWLKSRGVALTEEEEKAMSF